MQSVNLPRCIQDSALTRLPCIHCMVRGVPQLNTTLLTQQAHPELAQRVEELLQREVSKHSLLPCCLLCQGSLNLFGQTMFLICVGLAYHEGDLSELGSFLRLHPQVCAIWALQYPTTLQHAWRSGEGIARASCSA